ncbi:MAG: BolA/IbaG family iron-sulfur metabolism protein [Gammaproteobacteria bacterium SHHR-1]|uniref:BolA family protein n=1 Tax=Magnetovirga frankeli TaxID=947516 RepID=UPI001293F436|nr:BolA/IbaG family iron-sulfur metabolism protein [gamma proteobacterium SS-5]
MDQESVKHMIQQGFSEAEVEVGGEGCNLSVTVISPDFVGQSRIQRHRQVMDRVKALLESGELHALSVTTYTPEDWAKRP